MTIYLQKPKNEAWKQTVTQKKLSQSEYTTWDLGGVLSAYCMYKQ